MARKLLTFCFSLISLSLILVWVPAMAETVTPPPTKAELKKKLEYIQRFSNAFNHVKAHYFKKVDDKTLFENAIRGMMRGLDPHSAYLDKEEYSDLHEDTLGEFAGLGIEVTMLHGFIKVIAPIDGAPAKRAGVKAGDIIVRLDGKPVKGMTMREAVENMRGPKGSTLMVTVAREGAKKPLEIKIVRDIVKVVSVKSRMLSNDIGYLRIAQFQTPTYKIMLSHIKRLKNHAGGHLKGLVLDLRDNPGGLLDSSIDIADAFLDKDNLRVHFKEHQAPLIVYTKGRHDSARVAAKVHAEDIVKGTPIVVLINKGSASGSEIVAGALQDYKRAVVMGTRSFGKGSVQTVFALDKQHGLKITTALYYTPAGRSIQAEGIVPNIVVHPVTVKKPESDIPSFLLQHESEYENHIQNGHSKKHEKSEQADGDESERVRMAADPTQKLIYEDHMLFEAVNVLKALALKY